MPDDNDFKYRQNAFIGIAARFFLIVNVLKVPFHIFSWGTIIPKTFMIDLLAIPAILPGVVIGIKTAKLIPEKIYRYFIIISTVLVAFLLLDI